jgi:hypothetical protein
MEMFESETLDSHALNTQFTFNALNLISISDIIEIFHELVVC